MPKQEVLVIDRATWGCGSGAYPSCGLFDPCTGKKCCLGFDSLRLGATTKEITGHGYPSEVTAFDKATREQLRRYTDDLDGHEADLAVLNDSAIGSHVLNPATNRVLTLRSQAHREQLIAVGFKKYWNVKVKYVEKFPEAA